ncbi:MAG: hypothetical protein UHU21_08460 [Lachnospiraceae bacterium]|jgi:hypothetical protein|nr:hypothetical protein [Lachnospiraceae bacterium]
MYDENHGQLPANMYDENHGQLPANMYDENYALLRASRASASLQTFGFRSFCAISMRKTASSSCLGARQMSANARASPAFADA